MHTTPTDPMATSPYAHYEVARGTAHGMRRLRRPHATLHNFHGANMYRNPHPMCLVIGRRGTPHVDMNRCVVGWCVGVGTMCLGVGGGCLHGASCVLCSLDCECLTMFDLQHDLYIILQSQ